MEKEIKIGDEVRVLTGMFCGSEGTVVTIDEESLCVELDGEKKFLYVEDQYGIKAYVGPPTKFTRIVGNKRYFELVTDDGGSITP